MADYVLGLDIGPNSIGWALVEVEVPADGGEPRPVGLLDTAAAGHPPLGARVFPAGLDNYGTKKEKSLNQDRRAARAMRRVHQRRNARRRLVRRLLRQAGFWPRPSDSEGLSRTMALDPYEVRARGLDERLEPFELGRALYHIAQRRGFKSNRKSDRKAKEKSEMLGEISQLGRAIEEGGARTLGEYLHRLAPKDGANGRRPLLERGAERLRNRHTHRDMYEHEFALLLDAQAPHHPAITPEWRKQVHEAIFHQHPFEVTEERRRKAPSRANLHRSPALKRCPLEPRRRRAPWSEPDTQRFRILKQVNDLRVAVGIDDERPLLREERADIIAKLESAERVKFDQLRKLIRGVDDPSTVSFNLERGGRKDLRGDEIESRIGSAYGKREWKKLSEQDREQIRRLVLVEDDADRLKAQLLQLGLDEEKADKLSGLSPPDGYAAFSLEAIRKLLPYLEDGWGEYEAIQQAYPERREFREFSLLPSLVHPKLPQELRDITNPIVRRAVVEVRKVVNAIVREHGKPYAVVVELAREMKGNKEERDEISRRNRENEERRKKAADDIKKWIEAHERSTRGATSDEVNRYLLWKEQGGYCIYSGKPISMATLLSGAGELDVDHILPRWQSLDDSWMNKVLCFRDVNREKRDRTPAQWLGEDSEEFRALIARAEEMKRKNGLPGPKLHRLKMREVKAEDFAQRQLNDTRYISRLVVKYLNLLYPPDRRVGEKAVRCVRGQLTAELRRLWGLNGLLSGSVDAQGEPLKSREDHRHHAVDALVVALSSRAHLKRYQDYFRDRGDLDPWDVDRRHTRGEGFPLPWESLRDDADRALQEVQVSHRPTTGLASALHEETFYGRHSDGSYRTRKPLSDLTRKMIDKIVDPTVKRLVLDRLAERGWRGEDKLPKDWWQPEIRMPCKNGGGPPIRKARLAEKKESVVQLGDRGHRFAVVGNNHHLEVAADAAGAIHVRCVTVQEAADRVRRRGRPMVDRSPGNGLRFSYSLAKGESLLVGDECGTQRLCVVQTLTGNPMAFSTTFDLRLRDARDARPASEARTLRLRSGKKLSELLVSKVFVDPLGRVRPIQEGRS